MSAAAALLAALSVFFGAFAVAGSSSTGRGAELTEGWAAERLRLRFGGAVRGARPRSGALARR